MNITITLLTITLIISMLFHNTFAGPIGMAACPIACSGVCGVLSGILAPACIPTCIGTGGAISPAPPITIPACATVLLPVP